MAQVLGQLPKHVNLDVLIGYDMADDAGLFRIDAEHALVQTLDFFTPMVDDPYTYGAVADRVPFMPESYDLARTCQLPKTIASTWKTIERKTGIDPRISEPLRNIFLDPQTSGGLLI